MAKGMARKRANRWKVAQWSKGFLCGEIDENDIEDCASEAIARVLRVIARGRIPESTPQRRSLVWQCVRSAWSDYAKARGKATSLGSDDESVVAAAATESDQEREERERAEWESVAAIVRRTPTACHMSLLAAAYRESSTEAIAACGMSRATFYRRLKAAAMAIDTPARRLNRAICEALEEVRTGRAVDLSLASWRS
jgi:hypothetical protein